VREARFVHVEQAFKNLKRDRSSIRLLKTGISVEMALEIAKVQVLHRDIDRLGAFIPAQELDEAPFVLS
jgi:hypothetical protein